MKYAIALLLIFAVTIQISTQSRLGDDIKSGTSNMVDYMENLFNNMKYKWEKYFDYDPPSASIPQAIKDAGSTIGNSLKTAKNIIVN